MLAWAQAQAWKQVRQAGRMAWQTGKRHVRQVQREQEGL